MKTTLTKSKEIDNAIFTSHYGHTIKASYNVLCELFGKPQTDRNGEQFKNNYEWVLDNSKGNGITIYDYKYYRKLKDTEEIIWNIGAESLIQSTEAYQEIINLLSNKEIKTETYMVHVVGKPGPVKLHGNLLSAELEAERLAKKEKTTVYVFKAVSVFELTQITKTCL